MRYVIFILSMTILFSCSTDRDPFSVTDEGSYFGIYFLEDTSITEQDVAKMDMQSLVLRSDPWLTHQDIELYDFSAHCIYLKKDKSHFFEKFEGGLYQFSPVLISRPFVVVAGTERCYVGALHSSALSLAPVGPYIDELDVGHFPSDVIHISRAWSDDDDVRSSPKVKDVLIKQDLFHAGVEIELISFQLVDNSDTSTVDYSIKIENNDRDNLFVLDPAKMGSELFHYYTHGPHLWDQGRQLYLYAHYKEVDSPEPDDSWNFEWFTLIKSSQSMERTIRLKGYPHIPNGNYVGYVHFSNPINIAKDDRYPADGRVWIGSVRSNDLAITIQDE